jgi:proline racemase
VLPSRIVEDRDQGLPHGRRAVPDCGGSTGANCGPDSDRAPCRAIEDVLAADGRLPVGTGLRQDSIVDSPFKGDRTGEHVFTIDPHDPFVPGFLLW